MLIYNFKKELLGIDKKVLTTLGFNNLEELHNEVTDFADLFVKTPGFIHNFRHVHWIDYLKCAEENEEVQIIINVNGKNFQSILQISTQEESYIIHLHNLRELTHKESEDIEYDILKREPILKSV